MRRLTIGLVGAGGTLLAAIVLGGGFVYAGQLLPAPARDQTLDITATVTAGGTVVLPPERRSCLERFGLRLADGYLEFGGDVDGTCDGVGTVTREVLAVQEGDPPVGTAELARFDEYIFLSDPSAVGLAFTEVQVPTEGGDAPAWLVQGGGNRWAIVVHGRSATRTEGLRILPTLQTAGLPTLLITYRNDFAGGPPAEDDTGRFGQREWIDLAAAIDYAVSQGAEEVVLVGLSQGGSLIGYLLRNTDGELDARIAGIVLDAPLLSLRETLVQQARRRNIPGPLIPPILLGTQLVARAQAGFDVGDVDHVATFAASRAPLLLIHGVADDFVPIGPSDDLASRRDEALTYERFEAAGHVEAYNADSERYRRIVGDFLAGL